MQDVQEREFKRFSERDEYLRIRAAGITEYTERSKYYPKIEQRRLFANSEEIGYEFVQAFINNISFPKTLDELEFFATEHGEFNVEDVLYEDPVIWTVPRWAKINDVVFFMHSKTSISTITHLRTELNRMKSDYSDERYSLLMEWINKGLALYKQYGGKIFAIGRVSGAPEYDDDVMEDPEDSQFHWKSKVYAEISDIAVLPNPVDISQFNSFIMVSRQSGITPVLGREFGKLREVIQENNPIPRYFEKSISSAIPLSRITRDNWMTIPKEYRRRFVLEAQFRSFYVDFLLADLGDRKTIFKECRCIKAGMADSFVDNMIFLNGKYLPVEVKLSVYTQHDLKGQVAKYCYDDMIMAKDRKLLPEMVYRNRVLIIDTEAVFMYDADTDVLEEEFFVLDSLVDKTSVQTLKREIIQRL